jgi:hypothetical protein
MKIDIEHSFVVSLESYDIETIAATAGEYEPGTDNGDDCDYVRCGRVVILDVDKTLADLADICDDEYRGGVFYNRGEAVFTRQQFIDAAEAKFEAMLGDLMESQYEARRDDYEW